MPSAKGLLDDIYTHHPIWNLPSITLLPLPFSEIFSISARRLSMSLWAYPSVIFMLLCPSIFETIKGCSPDCWQRNTEWNMGRDRKCRIKQPVAVAGWTGLEPAHILRSSSGSVTFSSFRSFCVQCIRRMDKFNR